jgi:hypothetical protein
MTLFAIRLKHILPTTPMKIDVDVHHQVSPISIHHELTATEIVVPIALLALIIAVGIWIWKSRTK